MACLILFEIVCELGLILQPSTISYSSNGDYTWLQERFGWSRKDLLGGWREAAIEKLRASFLPTTEELGTVLATYMSERSRSFEGEIEYLRENLSGLDTREAALAAAFEFRWDSIKNGGNEPPKKALEPKTIDWIEAWKSRIPEIQKASSRVEAFQQFAELERQFEPIETAVGEFTAEVDAHIQLQVDISRGK